MVWSTEAPAKVNLALRMCGVRADGYHLVRTLLQSIALADRLTLSTVPGPFAIECDAPGVPTDGRNLAWKGAAALAAFLGRPLEGLRLHIEKHVPAEAGLGGGSADAAAAARLVAAAAGVSLEPAHLTDVIRPLGADVAYFAIGGTVLGEGIGDVLTPLADEPAAAVVLVRPPFGVATRDAYAWYDGRARSGTEHDEMSGIPGQVAERAPDGYGNDLEPPVVANHPEVGRIIARLAGSGARLAAMSGSGSACFGLFDPSADVSALLAGWPPGTRAWRTDLLSRTAYVERTQCRKKGGREEGGKG